MQVSSLGQQGKYTEAEAMDRQTLQLKKAVLGKDHPSTLGRMMNLATLLHKQGKYTEAGAIHQRVHVKSPTGSTCDNSSQK
jgi:hypothetical protein